MADETETGILVRTYGGVYHLFYDATAWSSDEGGLRIWREDELEAEFDSFEFVTFRSFAPLGQEAITWR